MILGLAFVTSGEVQVQVVGFGALKPWICSGVIRSP